MHSVIAKPTTRMVLDAKCPKIDEASVLQQASLMCASRLS
jgi:hypothetical protein